MRDYSPWIGRTLRISTGNGTDFSTTVASGHYRLPVSASERKQAFDTIHDRRVVYPLEISQFISAIYRNHLNVRELRFQWIARTHAHCTGCSVYNTRTTFSTRWMCSERYSPPFCLIIYLFIYEFRISFKTIVFSRPYILLVFKYL